MQPISRRDFVMMAAAGIAGAATGVPAVETLGQATRPGGEPRRPNIVFVFADQMRSSAMGCMGNPDVKTPNLDRLAGQGMLCTHAFSSAPVCSPYRGQLLTGQYSHVNGVLHNDERLPENVTSVADVLKGEGYATGYIGKWHLDAGRKAPAGDARRQGFIPPGKPRHGFDYWAALECSHNYYHTKYYGDTSEPVVVDGYEPDVQTDLAIEYMRQHKAHPFLLMLSWGPPHNPYKPPEKFNTYDPAKIAVPPNVPAEMQEEARKFIAQYYGLVSSLDANIARLSEAMEELGLAQDTIFIFTSDHGDMLLSHGQRLKQRPWEESAHVPFILRYPRHIEAGQTSDLLVNSVDLMPTLLSFCGAPIPKGVQGTDLSAALLGRDSRRPQSLYLALDARGENSPEVGPWRGVRTRDWLYTVHEKGDWLLHNLAKDPYEMTNLVDESTAKAKKAELKAMLVEWIKRTGDPFQLV